MAKRTKRKITVPDSHSKPRGIRVDEVDKNTSSQLEIFIETRKGSVVFISRRKRTTKKTIFTIGITVFSQ